MRANREGKAVVPGRGGYDSEIIEVIGGPDRMMPMPPAKSRGRLIPLGDGEDLTDGVPQRRGPGELLRKRKKRAKTPLVPTRAEIAALPVWAKIAFGARCARRVVAAFSYYWKQAPEHHLRAVSEALSVAERAASIASAAAGTCGDAFSHAGVAADAATVAHAAHAAHAVAHAAHAATCIPADTSVHPAFDAARVIFETATIDTPLTAQLRCIRRDFARLKRLAREQKWTDDTPVPPDVFGPMWPDGVEPYWAVEPPAPHG